MQFLLVEQDVPCLADCLGLASELGWDTVVTPTYGTACAALEEASADVILAAAPAAGEADCEPFAQFRRAATGRQAAVLLIGGDSSWLASDFEGVIDILSREVPAGELRGRFAMIDRYQRRFDRLHTDVRRLEQLGEKLNEHFQEVDQEMRLASRLQKDFLPDISKPIDNLRFAAMYRPATWVSGDIYDVFRIDEEHTGFYVADAVGHGVAASLLTMFIKRSVVAKRIEGARYTILTPGDTMAHLNDTLAAQALPHCQFVTACYGIVNHRTLVMEYSRGGHPYPLHINQEGDLAELQSSGGLLGLMRDQTFPVGTVQLFPGQKVLFYTDGVELAFQGKGDVDLDTTAYMGHFRRLAALPVDEMFGELEALLDGESGSLNPRDDVTLLALQVS